jgi:protein ImuB
VNAGRGAGGLRAGMRLAAAHALLPTLAMVEHDPQAEARWQQFLAAWAYRHSSLVSAQWAGCIVLEVRASFRLLGPWPRIERACARNWPRSASAHRIALAPTPRAARVLAGLQDGLAVSNPAAMQALLDRVPVRRAVLPGDTGERLQRMGIRDLRTLRGLPRDSLRRRFGLRNCCRTWTACTARPTMR